MASASDDTLKLLHAELASNLLALIRDGVPMFDKEGNETGTRKASAAEMSVAVAFLKNNDITTEMDDVEATRELREALAARSKKARPVMPDYLSDEVH